MTAPTRLYTIHSTNADGTRGAVVALVRAPTKAAALARYTAGALDVALPSQDELLAAYEAGHRPAPDFPRGQE